MKKIKVINTGFIALSVEIENTAGIKDFVHLQARSSLVLPSG